MRKKILVVCPEDQQSAVLVTRKDGFSYAYHNLGELEVHYLGKALSRSVVDRVRRRLRFKRWGTVFPVKIVRNYGESLSLTIIPFSKNKELRERLMF